MKKKRYLVKLIDGTVFTGKRRFWDAFGEDSGFRLYTEVHFLKCIGFKSEDLEVSGTIEVPRSSIVFISKYKVQG